MPDRPDLIDRGAFLKRAGGVFAIVLIDRAGLARTAVREQADLHHPDPRPGINSDRVLTAEALGDASKTKGVTAAYDAARTYPETFDGIACGCGCSDKGAEHRSLLVCYETKQPTGCGTCREEAKFVAGLAKEGKTLTEIRAGVDKKFG